MFVRSKVSNRAYYEYLAHRELSTPSSYAFPKMSSIDEKTPNAPPKPKARGIKKLILPSLKLFVGLGIIGFLVWQIVQNDGIDRLREGPIEYGWFVLGTVLMITCLLFGAMRWMSIAWAAELPLSPLEAIRWVAIGYASSFVSPGSTGGDIVKATLLAHKRPGLRARSITTVLVDRLMGLFIMLIYANAAILAIGLLRNSSEVDESSKALTVMCRTIQTMGIVAVVSFLMAIAPGQPLAKISRLLSSVPLLGNLFEGIATLAGRYNSGRQFLLLSLALGMVGNLLMFAAFYCAAKALPIDPPSFLEHLFIVPVASVAGALPISPNGLGTTELVTKYLYQWVGASGTSGAVVAKDDGTLVALGFRLIMVATASVATIYFFASRQKDEHIPTEEEIAADEAEERTGEE